MKNRIKSTGVILTCFMTIFAFYAFYLDRKGEDASTVGQNEIKILISESNEYLYKELRSLQQSTATRAMTSIKEKRNLDETWKNVKHSFVMRQNHKAGEKLFVDYCGPTMNIIDTSTGECRSAQVFVAVKGAV